MTNPAEIDFILGKLAPRHIRVLGLVARGMTNRQIADMMGFKTSQVAKNYLRQVSLATRIKGRVKLAIFVLKNREVALTCATALKDFERRSK